MRSFLAVLCLLPSLAWAQTAAPSPTPGDLTTLNGKTYKAARVMSVEPDGINYMFAGGMAKIPFEELPEDVRKRYNYDPVKADAYARADVAAQAVAARQAASDANVAMSAQRQLDIKTAIDLEKRDADAKAHFQLAVKAQSIARRGLNVRATIRQVLDQGALVSYKIRIGLSNWPEEEEPDWIYVAGIQDGRADGDAVETAIFPFGMFKYGNTLGAQKTVRGWALTPMAAAALSEHQK